MRTSSVFPIAVPATLRDKTTTTPHHSPTTSVISLKPIFTAMMFFKSALTLSALLVLASGLTLDRQAPAQEMQLIETKMSFKDSFSTATASTCEKEDEADCKEFCELAQQTSTCAAKGNKITCFCKGGKTGSNCEERCLLCAPERSAFEEASRILKNGGLRMEEL